MSLISFALRTCLKRALLGQTLAEERVFDSMVVPLDETPQAGMRPKIVVSTDDDMLVCTSFDLNVDQRELDIIIEAELSSEVEVDAGGVAFEIPRTDAGLEATLDVLHRQIMRALAEPGAPWADLFRHLAGEPKKILKRRGASNDKGVKFAARQIVITCMPANEPAYGQAPNTLWSKVIAAMQADDELAEYGDLVKNLIVGTPLPSWRVLQASMGWTDAAVHLLGPAPIDPAEIGEAPVQTMASLDRVDQEYLDTAGEDGVTLHTTTLVDGGTASFEPVQ